MGSEIGFFRGEVDKDKEVPKINYATGFSAGPPRNH